jgi:hydrogenase nickel incorporation protein HypA/HybF
MHELRIAEDLSSIVLEAAANGKLTKVTKVNVSFGTMIQIVPELFRAAFAEAVRDTPAACSEVEIEIIPVRIRCRNCRKEFSESEYLFSCSSCRSTEIDIVNGKELFIKSIEGE